VSSATIDKYCQYCYSSVTELTYIVELNISKIHSVVRHCIPYELLKRLGGESGLSCVCMWVRACISIDASGSQYAMVSI